MTVNHFLLLEIFWLSNTPLKTALMISFCRRFSNILQFKKLLYQKAKSLYRYYIRRSNGILVSHAISWQYMFQLVTYDYFSYFVFTYSQLSNEYSTCLNYTTWGVREWSKGRKWSKLDLYCLFLYHTSQKSQNLIQTHEAKQVFSLAF